MSVEDSIQSQHKQRYDEDNSTADQRMLDIDIHLLATNEINPIQGEQSVTNNVDNVGGIRLRGGGDEYDTAHKPVYEHSGRQKGYQRQIILAYLLRKDKKERKSEEHEWTNVTKR